MKASCLSLGDHVTWPPKFPGRASRGVSTWLVPSALTMNNSRIGRLGTTGDERNARAVARPLERAGPLLERFLHDRPLLAAGDIEHPQRRLVAKGNLAAIGRPAGPRAGGQPLLPAAADILHPDARFETAPVNVEDELLIVGRPVKRPSRSNLGQLGAIEIDDKRFSLEVPCVVRVKRQSLSVVRPTRRAVGGESVDLHHLPLLAAIDPHHEDARFLRPERRRQKRCQSDPRHRQSSHHRALRRHVRQPTLGFGSRSSVPCKAASGLAIRSFHEPLTH